MTLAVLLLLLPVRAGHRSAAGPDCAHTECPCKHRQEVQCRLLTLEKLRKCMKTFILTAESTGCTLGLLVEHAERRTETTWRKRQIWVQILQLTSPVKSSGPLPADR